MARHKRIRLAAAVAAGAVTLASLPTAGLALGSLPEAEGRGAFAALTPASADPELAAFLARKGGTKAQLIRFTPAGAAERTDRSVTVAVRIDEQAAQAISVRSSIEAVLDQVAGESRLRIAPTRYNLGLSRGYQSFARPTVPTISRDLSDEVPDLAQIRTAPGAKEETPRGGSLLAGPGPAGAARRFGQAGQPGGLHRHAVPVLSGPLPPHRRAPLPRGFSLPGGRTLS